MLKGHSKDYNKNIAKFENWLMRCNNLWWYRNSKLIPAKHLDYMKERYDKGRRPLDAVDDLEEMIDVRKIWTKV